MAESTGAIRVLIHDLHAHESAVEERRAGQVPEELRHRDLTLSSAAAGNAGQHVGQTSSGWRRRVKKR